MSEHDGNDGNGRDDVPVNDDSIALLATFAEPAPAGFLGRLRNRIHRRELAGEVARLGWYAPFAIFMEYVNMIFGLLSGVDEAGPDGGER
jgi:hypothetical protein